MKALNPMDRRAAQRFHRLHKVGYSTKKGAGRGELINLSEGGARLTTGPEVVVGDHLFLVVLHGRGQTYSEEFQVRWCETLPCGLRQVIGVGLVASRTGTPKAA